MSSPSYTPRAFETKWYAYWLAQGFFHAEPNIDAPSYAMIMPPPNVTGRLHMGHVLNNTIQDVLVRKARMEGKNTCWVPGIDHASIATEAKVAASLRKQGILKSNLSREKFLSHTWAWKEKYSNIILEQLKRLGVSCDWDRTCFTLDPHPSEAVNQVFVQLYEQGYLYRDTRMIYWDPVGQTALSDEEVIYKEVQGQLYYLRYAVIGSDEHITLATTRPETILGDTAVGVHPEDNRYRHLQRQQVMVPLVNRPVPIIADAYVDPTFGTGCLKITPAHDVNDHDLGKKHGLAFIDILNQDGTLSPAAQHYVGKDRFVVRKEIVQKLQSEGVLIKIEPYTHHVGFSERTDTVVEPRLSAQWFVKMKNLAAPALEWILDGTIQFYPPKFKRLYQTWIEGVRDWCISRQLWWGNRIPAYYLPDDTVIVALDKAAALKKAQNQTHNLTLTAADLRQDEDVLDTWFSSWLWPINVFDGIRNPHNPTFGYFYPTNDLVTAPEIIFFWVARMMMAGHALKGMPPFKNVYFTGIVRDKQGRKMSKSLGNSPDPQALIEQYSADGVRVGMLLSAPAGNDLLFDVKLCEQGKKFAYKIWNAFLLFHGWSTTEQAEETHTIAIQWFQAKLNQAIQAVDTHFKQFRISDALMTLYKLVWDDFCSWYLEMIKPTPGQPLDTKTYQASVGFFETLLSLLHPFIPFLTEELWHLLQERRPRDCLVVAPWPQAATPNTSLLQQATAAFELIVALRNSKNQAQVQIKRPLTLYLAHEKLPAWLIPFVAYVKKLAHLTTIVCTTSQPPNTANCVIQGTTFYLGLGQAVSKDLEKKRVEKKLTHARGLLSSVLQKLNNKHFVQHAPAQVVALEHKKRADAEAQCKALETQLEQL